MFPSFVVFVLAVYGLAFLLADARIFGCDAEEYSHLSSKGLSAAAHEVGIFKVRPYLLRLHFFQELFHCYFCLGVWCGPAIHVLLLNFFDTRYWLYHEPTLAGYSQAILICALISGPLTYIVNTVIKRFE